MPLDAYIVSAVRTPAGKNRGSLSKWHPVDLGATAIDALVERTKINGGLVDDVIFGCVSQVGAQSGNIGRNVVLACKSLPEHVPGTTVDRQCGSAQQAVHFAVQAVLSGTMDVVIAGGVETMSSIPIGSSVFDGMRNGHGQPFNAKGIEEKYPGKVFSQFSGAEMLAKKYDLSREEMDKFGCESHKRAATAIKSGHFDREIVPVKGEDKEGKEILLKHDEGVRPDVTYESIAKLKLLQSDGRLTAATASQISDGAAAVLICNSAGLKKLGLKPKARFVALSVVGSDPEIMLEGPIPATVKVLKTSGLKIEDIDLYEVNEAFASVPLAWAKALKADIGKLNVNGGAMALGHPFGMHGCQVVDDVSARVGAP